MRKPGKPGSGKAAGGKAASGRAAGGKADVYSVTGVRSSLTDDVKGRQRRYALAMTIRTICFLLCVVTPSPLRWGFFVGALVLPYIAVVIANGGRENGGPGPAPVALPTRVELLPVRHENLSPES